MISPLYSAPALAKVLLADPITTSQIREHLSPRWNELWEEGGLRTRAKRERCLFLNFIFFSVSRCVVVVSIPPPSENKIKSHGVRE